MEQLPPLVYRRAGPHRNRIALDMDPSREGIHHHRDKAAMNGAPGYCLKNSIQYTTLLPAECRILVFKPGECVLKMLEIEIWPIFIPDIEIRINRLHRKKTA
jgi:hypothetical protein